jgi:hypothetical protein
VTAVFDLAELRGWLAVGALLRTCENRLRGRGRCWLMFLLTRWLGYSTIFSLFGVLMLGTRDLDTDIIAFFSNVDYC